MKEKQHLNGLNGLRAIAAVSVILSHAKLSELQFSGPNLNNLAQYAVTIFFTLSGFLITYLLFIEKKKTGISIKNFYMRRILRIWPLYYLYMIAAVITIIIYGPGQPGAYLLWFLFFAANVPTLMHISIPYLSHYWTLGVEEQFYLFWPWIIKRSMHVLKALIIFTVAFFIVKLFCRIIYYRSGNINPLWIMSIMRFECMAVGGIAALLCLRGNKIFFRVTTHVLVQAICWLSVAFMVINKFHITPFLDQDLAAIVTVGLIVNLSFNKSTLISLENRFFDLMGRISYGMYIIHPLVIFYFKIWLNYFTLTPGVKIIIMYAGVFLITTALAWLSYNFYEKKFLLLKKRFAG